MQFWKHVLNAINMYELMQKKLVLGMGTRLVPGYPGIAQYLRKIVNSPIIGVYLGIYSALNTASAC